MEQSQLLKLLLAAVIVVVVIRMISCRKKKSVSWSTSAPQTERYDWNDDAYLEQDDGPMVEDYADYDPNELTFESFTAPNATAPPVTTGPLAKSVDLLPKPVAGSSDFGEFAPKNLTGQNFLDPTKYIGVDTQGSSLRNANYSLRKDPPIPKVNIGPWAQSTIEADMYRKDAMCA